MEAKLKAALPAVILTVLIVKFVKPVRDFMLS